MNQNSKGMKILLVDGKGNPDWITSLRDAVRALDRNLETVDQDSIELKDLADYDLVLLDAGYIHDILSLLSSIRAQYPETRVVVFSPEPNWKQATILMLAGAVFYAKKTPCKCEIRTTLEISLARNVPAFSHETVRGGEA